MRFCLGLKIAVLSSHCCGLIWWAHLISGGVGGAILHGFYSPQPSEKLNYFQGQILIFKDQNETYLAQKHLKHSY